MSYINKGDRVIVAQRDLFDNSLYEKSGTVYSATEEVAQIQFDHLDVREFQIVPCSSLQKLNNGRRLHK
jgi:hypothetical protein